MTTLATPRLHLRLLGPGDEALYLALYGDAQTMRHVVAPPGAAALRRGFAAAVACNGETPARRRFWVMADRAGGRPVGLLGLDLAAGGEVGAVLAPADQGCGYATEAIAALADHAFGALGLDRLHTRHDPGHAPAAGLMARLGFEPVDRRDAARGWTWQLDAARWQAVRAQATAPRRIR